MNLLCGEINLQYFELDSFHKLLLTAYVVGMVRYCFHTWGSVNRGEWGVPARTKTRRPPTPPYPLGHYQDRASSPPHPYSPCVDLAEVPHPCILPPPLPRSEEDSTSYTTMRPGAGQGTSQPN